MRLTKDYVNYSKRKLALGGDLDSPDVYSNFSRIAENARAGATPVISGMKTPSAIGSAIGPAAALGTTIIDSVDQGNQFGRQAIGSSVGKGALAGAATGFALGTAVPVIGNAVGAVAGGLIGGGIAAVKGFSDKAKEDRYKSKLAIDAAHSQQMQSSARLMSDPSIVTGGQAQGYYANGGQLKPLAKGVTDVIGPSHEQGGVQIGSNEVEGKETIDDGYVFSHKLGFADAHRPLARAMGRIEEKPYNKATATSLARIKDRVENMKLAQEFVKSLNEK